MASEEHGRNDESSEPQVRRDEGEALRPVADDEGEGDAYAGPDPERADDPPVPEEDQGV